MTTHNLLDWLMQSAGPVIRYRTANELSDNLESASRESLRRDLLQSPEVGKWLARLGCGPIHHSVDTAAGNVMGKLLEFGLHAGIPEFDAQMLPFIAHIVSHPTDALMLVPFLIRAGYWQHAPVTGWFLQRLHQMHTFAKQGDYDVFLTADEAAGVPKAWRGEPIYRPELLLPAAEGYILLPTCFDWYAMAYLPKDDLDILEMINTVAAYASDPRFQAITRGCGWDKARHRCWAGGDTFLAVATRVRIMLFLECAANMPAARDAAWFKQTMREMEGYRTPRGTYLFPADVLKERPNSVHLYTASHMGLAENRRVKHSLELESTFRMLLLQRRLHANIDGE